MIKLGLELSGKCLCSMAVLMSSMDIVEPGVGDSIDDLAGCKGSAATPYFEYLVQYWARYPFNPYNKELEAMLNALRANPECTLWIVESPAVQLT